MPATAPCAPAEESACCCRRERTAAKRASQLQALDSCGPLLEHDHYAVPALLIMTGGNRRRD